MRVRFLPFLLAVLVLAGLLPGLRGQDATQNTSVTRAAQSPAPAPPPEVRKWNLFAGDWALSGVAKDGPAGPEYKVDWFLHEHWILSGFFMQVDQVWKANGQEAHSLEILSYDPVRKTHTSTGFSSDGSTWTLTASFHDATVIEEGVSQDPHGQITTCRMTWLFSGNRKELSGTQECQQSGRRWTSLLVKGRRSK